MLHWPHFEDQCSVSLLQVSRAIIITFGAITVGIKRRVGKPGWLLCWFPSAGWWWSGRRVCQSESLDHTGVSWFHKQSFQPDSHTCLSPSANNKTIVGFHNIKSQFGLNCEGQSLDCHCNKNPSFKAVINKLFFFFSSFILWSRSKTISWHYKQTCMISFIVCRHWPPTTAFTTLNCWFYWDFHNHSSSYLQSNDTLTSLYLLVVEMPCLFVSIFHPNIDFCVHTFGLCLKRYDMQVKGLVWTLIRCLKQ